MKFAEKYTVIDSHTVGAPTRIVVDGMPAIEGRTMLEKKQYLANHYDHIRTALMHEPRGHNDMFGAIITTPCRPEADFGIIFMDGGGYLNMCGHGSIGAATVAVSTGIVAMQQPLTVVKMDTPAGLVEARVVVENDLVKEVSITNVAAFHYLKDVKLTLEGYGEVQFDISFGGSFFAILEAKQIGLTVTPENIEELNRFGIALRRQINQAIAVQHPLIPEINRVDLVEIYDRADDSRADYKNVVVFGQGQIDRSPCGTGTSAKIATMVSKGELGIRQNFVFESIMGTLLRGQALERTKVGDYEAVVPEITGSAYITGFCQFVIDERDPLKHGFTI